MISSAFENDLTCQLCHKLFESPRVLPCLHITCKACIETLKPSRDGGVFCPLCETPALLPQEDVTKLPTASFISNMIDVTQTLKRAHESNIVCDNCCSKDATAYCTDCALFQCEDCCKSHDVLKVLKEHKVTTLKELDRCNFRTKTTPSMCSKHTLGKLELYCCDCECLVCIECAYLDHPKQNHSVKPAMDIAFSIKEDIKTSMASLAASATQLQGILASTSQRVVALLEQEQIIIQLIKELSDQLMPSLMSERDTVLHRGQNLFNLMKSELQSQARSMELFQVKIRTVLSFLKCLTEHSCDEEVVYMKQIVCTRIEQLKKMFRELNNSLVLVHMEWLREVCKELQLELKSDAGLFTGKSVKMAAMQCI